MLLFYTELTDLQTAVMMFENERCVILQRHSMLARAAALLHTYLRRLILHMPARGREMRISNASFRSEASHCVFSKGRECTILTLLFFSLFN